MKNTVIQLVGSILFITLFAAVAIAGEFNEVNGQAIGGYDVVAYQTEQKAVVGQSAYSHEYKGSKFVFASAKNRDLFKASPENYTPKFGGYCAYGASKGYKAKVDPEAFTVVDNKLYLNYSHSVKENWLKDKEALIEKANSKWEKIK